MIFRSRVKFISLFCIVAIYLSALGVASAADFNLRRICTDGRDNTITTLPYSDTCSGISSFKVFGRTSDFNPWVAIDSGEFFPSSFVHVNADAFQRGDYYIVIRRACDGALRYSDTLSPDIVAPDRKELDSVSVMEDGSLALGWDPDKGADTRSYILYRVEGGLNVPIQEPLGWNTTYFGDQSPASSQQSKTGGVTFAMATRDSCMNAGAIGKQHKTIALSVSQDFCSREVSVAWTNYSGWDTRTKSYILYYQDLDSGYYKRLVRIDANRVFIESMFFANKHTYRFFVRAVEDATDSFTSSSNRVDITINWESALTRPYLVDNVSSADGSAVRFRGYISDTSGVQSVEVYRSSNTKTYRLVSTVTAFNGAAFEFNDVLEDAGWYFYKARVISRCGNVGDFGEVMSNIHLTMSSLRGVLDDGEEGFIRTFTWNGFPYYRAGLSQLFLERSYRDANSDLVDESVYGGPDTSHVHQGYVPSSDSSTICYKVVALENVGNSFGVLGVSISNSVCFYNGPVVFIPNSFNPMGLYNTIWRPSVLHVDAMQSELLIVDRWGEIVKQVVGVPQWNGMDDSGKLYPAGLYRFRLVIRGLDASLRVYTGNLHLVN